MEENRNELEKKVQNVLEQIRPYLQSDGGDIKYINLTDDNIVNVELMGACGSCPYSLMTLKNGVETAIKKAIPAIKAVEAVNI
ncbi:MAG TPA: NifU family protein [Bacteroidales bacterium]|jgi:Fe-S cluster biogenesis protein NfuA|nr:NifU family protein [Bacteroidales bacterium]MDX9906561.1 NifU family protein [Bacteroidales bacterium]HNQ83715.1 NifU family protein [Bacteroidales bacterium]